MKKSKSQFMDWFETQHGKYPSDKSMIELSEEISNLKINLYNKDLIYKECQEYELKRRSALYAWIARDKL